MVFPYVPSLLNDFPGFVIPFETKLMLYVVHPVTPTAPTAIKQIKNH